MKISIAQSAFLHSFYKRCWDLVPKEQACIHALEELGEVVRPILDNYNQLSENYPTINDEVKNEIGSEVSDVQTLIFALSDIFKIDLVNSLRRYCKINGDKEITFNELFSYDTCDSIEVIILNLVSEMGLLSTSIMEFTNFKNKGSNRSILLNAENTLARITILLSALMHKMNLDFDYFINKRIESIIERDLLSDTKQIGIYLINAKNEINRLIGEFNIRQENEQETIQ